MKNIIRIVTLGFLFHLNAFLYAQYPINLLSFFGTNENTADTIEVLKPTGVRHGDLKMFWDPVCNYMNKSKCTNYLIIVHENGIGSEDFNLSLSNKFIEFSERYIFQNSLLNEGFSLKFIAKGSSEPLINKTEIDCISDAKLLGSIMMLNSRIQIIRQCNNNRE